ncbi:uncharacterized protein LOC123680055 [Harmonia axyridis]|uniref:uncharacterized protein LOC123680055 n=1 Tax=Harmonia axyridis TaxID=115357 RepID=UPI001E276AAC|nr:uncharacterized protein LOC123680055 [Harmonia axyridis]
MPKMKKCCVRGCTDEISVRHRFPKRNLDIFEKWLQIIQPKNWQELSRERIYDRYYVCHSHFKENYHLPGSQRGLTCHAIPTIGIPDSSKVCTERDLQEMLMEIDYVQDPILEDSTEPMIVEEQPVIESRGKSLLRQLKVPKTKLTQREKMLYKLLKKTTKKYNLVSNKFKIYKNRLSEAKKFMETNLFGQLATSVNQATLHFFATQIRNQKRQLNARRFTIDEKILALALYKSSPKGYRLLSKMFALPTGATLRRLLLKLEFKPGVNAHIMEHLKKVVYKMNAKEKVCALIFDEMSVQTFISYSPYKDEIVGLEDYGDEKKALIADHANVFLIKGLYKSYKQPLAFTFSRGAINSYQLKGLISILIKECQNIGLDVVATICDQGTTNVKAVQLLLEEGRQEHVDHNHFGFFVNNKEIVPLFDTPHLIKGLRNNLLTKDAHFLLNDVPKKAKWSHIQRFYDLDISDPSTKICAKLTDSHVLPEKMNKMKVKLCTQVFSNTVGTLMKRISRWDIEHKLSLPSEAADTAELILFLDKLFDSLNVSKIRNTQGKFLKEPVTRNSEHENFWQNAIKIFNSMTFYDDLKKKNVAVPSIKNFIFSLKGFTYLKRRLLTEKKFKYILTGAFNQDCLENFFSYIRGHGVRNTNPNIAQFMSSFKSLTLNNFMTSHSVVSNCEEDLTSHCLDNLKPFVFSKSSPSKSVVLEELNIVIPKLIVLQEKSKFSNCTLIYMSGFISKILLKDKLFKQCDKCKKKITFNSQELGDIDFIQVRQYKYGKLTKPGQCVSFLFRHSLNYLFYIIPRICEKKNISLYLKSFLMKNLDFQILNCNEHSLGEKVCETIIRCSLHWWCKQVNEIMNGTDTKFCKFLRTSPCEELVDPIKLMAKRIFDTKRKKKCI